MRPDTIVYTAEDGTTVTQEELDAIAIRAVAYHYRNIHPDNRLSLQ